MSTCSPGAPYVSSITARMEFAHCSSGARNIKIRLLWDYGLCGLVTKSSEDKYITRKLFISFKATWCKLCSRTKVKIKYTSLAILFGTIEKPSSNDANWAEELSDCVKDACFGIEILCSFSSEIDKIECPIVASSHLFVQQMYPEDCACRHRYCWSCLSWWHFNEYTDRWENSVTQSTNFFLGNIWTVRCQ